MVVYDGVLIKIEPVYGETEDQIIEMWATFRIDKYEIETFLDNYYVVPRKNLLEGIGKHFNITIVLMGYDLYRINIEEKMLKQITKFPGEDKYGRSWPSIPMYFVMGEIKEKEKFYKEYRGKKIPSARMKVDCGILLDVVKINCSQVDELFEGDHVALIGMMYGEIVKDGDKIDIQAKDE